MIGLVANTAAEAMSIVAFRHICADDPPAISRLPHGGFRSFHDLLQMHDLTRNEFRHSQSDHVDGTIDFSDDPPRLLTGQPVCFGTQT